MHIWSTIALGGLAAAQQIAVPSGVQTPATAGFTQPTILPSRGGKAVCVSGLVPVTVTAQNLKLNFDIPSNVSQVTETFLSMVTSGSPFMSQINGGMQNVSGTYNIFSELCLPAGNAQPKTVQVLTHGVGFDRTYWDFAPGYSYVDVAADFGYATFLYDRLGVGMSSKPDAIQIVQAPLQVAIAEKLISMVRNGTFGNLKPSKVVAVGHSFGSVISSAVAAKYPKSIDAAILTGYSANSSGMAAFLLSQNLNIASAVSPYRFSGLSNGYLITNSPIGVQYGFFRAPFDPNILALATATGGTVTFGELFSLAAVIAPAPNFTAPVAIVNGAEDLPFCFGNCSYPTNLAQIPLDTQFAQSKAKATYLANSTGHGLNLQYSALGAYHFINYFLGNNSITA